MEDEIRTDADVTASAPQKNDALGAMLSNPAILQGLAAALGNSTGNHERETEGAETQPTSVPPMGDGLSALLSNPELLSRLPQIMAAIKPLMESVAVQGKGAEKETQPAPTLCREQLLLALKPFLSRERCDAVDTILRISKLGAVFQMLK